jgi:parallel beta-helix repeat protein
MFAVTRRALLAGGAVMVLGALAGRLPAQASVAGVVNETGGAAHGSLHAAIASAGAGDVLRIAGLHIGQFVIDKPLTLRGEPGATLDAGGAGTVLVIAADDVVLEGLTLTGSGDTATFSTLWGDAGLRLEGSRTRASGLTITGNDYGVIVRGGETHEVTRSEIGANREDGIRIFGGKDHSIADSRIWGNRNGIYVDALYEGGSLTEIVVPDYHDRASLEHMARIKDSAVHATGHRIERNLLPGNEVYGIALTWHTNACLVADNDIGETGIARPLTLEATRYWEQVLGATTGANILLDNDALGSGIMLICFPERNTIRDNRSHDNLAWGIGLDSTSSKNLIEANRLLRNRDGLRLQGSFDNTIRTNLVGDNSAHGIIIDARIGAAALRPSSGNLVVGNAMTGNPVNAFDSSDQVADLADIEVMIDAMPLPDAVRDQFKADPRIRQMMIDQMMAQYQPGTNRWDDGALGNHFDDFDDPAEGFRDDDGDGVGEVAHPIPGGGMVDHFPLTATKAEAL